MVLHGLPKIQNPMGWMQGPQAMPGFLQLLAALAEFGGGIALMLGFFTRLGALGIAITMAVAIFTAHAGDPFVAQGKRSFESAALYLAAASMLLLGGPGAYSVDYLFARRRQPSGSAATAGVR